MVGVIYFHLLGYREKGIVAAHTYVTVASAGPSNGLAFLSHSWLSHAILVSEGSLVVET